MASLRRKVVSMGHEQRDACAVPCRAVPGVFRHLHNARRRVRPVRCEWQRRDIGHPAAFIIVVVVRHAPIFTPFGAGFLGHGRGHEDGTGTRLGDATLIVQRRLKARQPRGVLQSGAVKQRSRVATPSPGVAWWRQMAPPTARDVFVERHGTGPIRDVSLRKGAGQPPCALGDEPLQQPRTERLPSQRIGTNDGKHTGPVGRLRCGRRMARSSTEIV